MLQSAYFASVSMPCPLHQQAGHSCGGQGTAVVAPHSHIGRKPPGYQSICGKDSVVGTNNARWQTWEFLEVYKTVLLLIEKTWL